MAILKTFCCRCSLATGTKIIGWMYLVGCIILLLLILFCNIETCYENHINVSSHHEYVLRYSAISAPSLIVSSILLLIGAAKERRGLLLPWIILQSAVLWDFYKYTINEMLVNLNFNYEIMLSVLGLLWNLYILIVVISFFQKLNKNRDANVGIV